MEPFSQRLSRLFPSLPERRKSAGLFKYPVIALGTGMTAATDNERPSPKEYIMSNSEIPAQKKLHASGTWRAIRSMAVPANVTALHSSVSPSALPSGPRQLKNIEEASVKRNSPGYFETADPSFSKS